MSRVEIPGNTQVKDPELSARQRQVFEALVDIHARTARAVGSETLVTQARISLSPASIRRQTDSTSCPNGVTQPMPVTTEPVTRDSPSG